MALNKCRGGGGVCAGGCLGPKGVYFVVNFFFTEFGGLNGPASQLESRRLRSLAPNEYRRRLSNWSRVVSEAWL